MPVGPDEHVRWLDVAVDDAETVEALEGFDQLRKDVAQARLVERSTLGCFPRADGYDRPDVARERFTVHQVHGEEPVAPVVQQFMRGHQVAVRHLRQDAELALEAHEGRPLGVAQHLEGDLSGALPIERLVDHAEAAFADLTQEFEPLGAGEARRNRLHWGCGR